MDKTVFSRPAFIAIFSIIIFMVALAPVLCFRYFPTVDGPSHLYNANIICDLWFNSASVYSHFFQFNSQLVPNWTGHFTAVVAGTILPVWMTEKLLVLFITAGVPAGIYRLSRAFGGDISWRILLLLPFIYPITLYLGFFNFMIGIVISFFALAWIKEWEVPGNKSRVFCMTLVLTLVYFSHIMAFGITLLCTCAWMIWEVLINRHIKLFTQLNFQKLICFIPGMLLAISFFSSRSMEGFRKQTEQVPFSDLTRWIGEGLPLVGLNGAEEIDYTKFFMKVIALLLITGVVFRIIKKEKQASGDLLLICAIVILCFYFIIPDAMASGGFISLRLLYLSLLFAVAWLLTQKFPLWISIAAGVAGIYSGYSSLPYRMQVAADLDSHARQYVAIVSDVLPGSVILPVNYSQNWLHTNISGYAGASQELIVLDNYEANFGEFPLMWKKNAAPGKLAGNFAQSLNPTLTIENYEKVTGNKIDAVIRWNFDENTTDSIAIASDKILRSHFNKVKYNQNGELFFDRR